MEIDRERLDVTPRTIPPVKPHQPIDLAAQRIAPSRVTAEPPSGSPGPTPEEKSPSVAVPTIGDVRWGNIREVGEKLRSLGFSLEIDPKLYIRADDRRGNIVPVE